MIDFHKMIENETPADVIACLASGESSSLQHLDRLYSTHYSEKFNNLDLMELLQSMLDEEKLQHINDKGRLGKGPNWVKPDFMSEGKYGIAGKD